MRRLGRRACRRSRCARSSSTTPLARTSARASRTVDPRASSRGTFFTWTRRRARALEQLPWVRARRVRRQWPRAARDRRRRARAARALGRRTRSSNTHGERVRRRTTTASCRDFLGSATGSRRRWRARYRELGRAARAARRCTLDRAAPVGARRLAAARSSNGLHVELGRDDVAGRASRASSTSTADARRARAQARTRLRRPALSQRLRGAIRLPRKAGAVATAQTAEGRQACTMATASSDHGQGRRQEPDRRPRHRHLEDRRDRRRGHARRRARDHRHRQRSRRAA